MAAVIGLGTLVYTDSFLKELRSEEVRRAKLFVEAMDIAQNSNDDVNLNFVLKIIEGNTTIPIIVVGEDGNVSTHRNLDPEKSKNKEWVKKQVKLMAEENEPIEVEFAENRKIMLYYKESTSSFMVGILPILENLSVIVTSLEISFSISVSAISSAFCVRSISIHPIKEDKGVPI